MRAALFLVVAIIGTAGRSEAIGAEHGRVLWVIDGDTYQISHAGAPDGESVRARHFDTPEKGDRARCEAERAKAARATAEARRLLPRGAMVLLSDFGRDRYGRLLATVTLSDGTDLAAWFIRSGLAHPYEGGWKVGWCFPLRRPSVPTSRRNAPRRGVLHPNPPRHMRGGSLRGFQPLARSMGKRRASPVVWGRPSPENLLRRSLARPPGFGWYPRHPQTLDLATPSLTTWKRCAILREC